MAVAQGSGSATWMVVVGVLVAVHCCSLLASSATLTVGDSQGWTIGVDYTTWAAAHTFAVNDVLLFPYAKGAHDVVEVPKASYDACSSANSVSTFSGGNTTVTLTTAGAYYFLCSFPGHCAAGMLLAVTVGGNATNATAPAPSPNATAPAPTTNATAPVPAAAPVSATAPVPAPAPASTPTPSSTPAPAPASTPTPGSPPSPASASSPPSPGTPSTPPNSASSLFSSTSLATVVLVLGGAFLAV